MTEDENRPATLHNGAVSTDFPTLRDAIMAWHRLRPEQAQRASIRIIGGELFAAAKIPKLQWVEVEGRLRIFPGRSWVDWKQARGRWDARRREMINSGGFS
jgi:hypothetical protein